MLFNGYLSYFLGPLFNGEEGPNPRLFKDLKEFKRAQIKEAQTCNEPENISMVLEAPAGHLGSNRMSERSLAQRPNAAFSRQIYGR